MRENEIAFIRGAGFLAHVLRLVFNEADTNYTICDINVTNCYSKIIYINIEDKVFLLNSLGITVLI